MFNISKPQLMDNTNNVTLLQTTTCNRCKVNNGEVTCQECSPFNVFCSNCDGYVHSLPSKRQHNRVSLQINSVDNLNNENQQKQMMFYSVNQSQIETLPYSNRSVDMNNIGNISQQNQQGKNYLNEIKQIYEGEKEELRNQNYLLEKSLSNTTNSLNQRIGDLEHSLNETNTKHAMEIKLLIYNHDEEIKRIVSEKDNQINYLYNQNFELQKANDELLTKLNQYADLINQNKLIYGDKIGSYENTICTLNKDLDELKNFYEKKIAFFTSNFSSEKNKIINSYENTIEKLNEGYNDSKNKYLNVINQRDNEIKELIVNHRTEIEDMNNTIEELKSNINMLRDDQEKLMKINAELKAEIGSQGESLERAKKEIRFHIKEKNKIEREIEGLSKNYTQLKVENDKMNRLTHGKFRKTKTISHEKRK